MQATSHSGDGHRTRLHIQRAVRAVSYMMLLKGIVGGAVTTLALFGVIVPYLGIDPTLGHEGAAAGAGAVMGALLAFKS